MDPHKPNQYKNHELRTNDRVFKTSTRLKMSEASFNIDAAKVWNAAPLVIRNSTTLAEAKRCIKKYAKSLPV